MAAVVAGGGRGGGGGGGGALLLHATGSMTYYHQNQYSRGRGSSGNVSATVDAGGAPALPFDLSDFMLYDDQQVPVDPTGAGYGEPRTGAAALPAAPAAGQGAAQRFGDLSSIPAGGADNSDAIRIAAQRGSRRGEPARIAFRTKSVVEVLDDGFRWRKYGKKSVKNNSHPRNYYRCSTEGCSVKKRVERDEENPSYVITTYEGRHNHMSPGVVYYTAQDAATGHFYVAGCETPPCF